LRLKIIIDGGLRVESEGGRADEKEHGGITDDGLRITNVMGRAGKAIVPPSWKSQHPLNKARPTQSVIRNP